MAFSTELVERIREVLHGSHEINEKKMFGGLAFLLNGNMACGVSGDDLMVRVGPEAYEKALEQPHTAVFDMTGRPMTGWILVKPAGTSSNEELKRWVEQGVKFVQSLPAK